MKTNRYDFEAMMRLNDVHRSTLTAMECATLFAYNQTIQKQLRHAQTQKALV